MQRPRSAEQPHWQVCPCYSCERFRSARVVRGASKPLPPMQVQPEANRLAGVQITVEGDAI